jgi:hypothetical protein
LNRSWQPLANPGIGHGCILPDVRVRQTRKRRVRDALRVVKCGAGVGPMRKSLCNCQVGFKSKILCADSFSSFVVSVAVSGTTKVAGRSGRSGSCNSSRARGHNAKTSFMTAVKVFRSGQAKNSPAKNTRFFAGLSSHRDLRLDRESRQRREVADAELPEVGDVDAAIGVQVAESVIAFRWLRAFPFDPSFLYRTATANRPQ